MTTEAITTPRTHDCPPSVECAVCYFFASLGVPEGFDRWLATRPEIVKDLVKRFPPKSFWQLSNANRPRDDYYTPYAYGEDGTLTMTRISAVTNLPRWRVFGLSPDDMVPMRCDA